MPKEQRYNQQYDSYENKKYENKKPHGADNSDQRLLLRIQTDASCSYTSGQRFVFND
jgi:hypothetical protein